MKREFLIDRQGKTFALHAGLLDEAHQRGLVSIATKIEQLPSPANGETTICSAVVTLQQDGTVKQFHGIGDANPQNVGRNIVAHAIRMAETRAKARALRDALNIGAAALEELGDDDEPPAYQPRQEQRQPQQAQAAVKAQIPATDSPLRVECRDVMERMKKINPATQVTLPPEDAPNSAFNLWLDEYRPKLEAAERRGQTAQNKGR